MPDDLTTAQRLRQQFGDLAETDATVNALLTEACRIADRLDRAHDFETGKANWYEVLQFRMGDDMETIHVSINGVLTEARQQANTLNTLVGSLLKFSGSAVTEPSKPAANPLDELTIRRNARPSA